MCTWVHVCVYVCPTVCVYVHVWACVCTCTGDSGCVCHSKCMEGRRTTPRSRLCPSTVSLGIRLRSSGLDVSTFTWPACVEGKDQLPRRVFSFTFFSETRSLLFLPWCHLHKASWVRSFRKGWEVGFSSLCFLSHCGSAGIIDGHYYGLFIFFMELGIELRSSGLCNKCFYPLSHLLPVSLLLILK